MKKNKFIDSEEREFLQSEIWRLMSENSALLAENEELKKKTLKSCYHRNCEILKAYMKIPIDK